jgi:hypothetical protein
MSCTSHIRVVHLSVYCTLCCVSESNTTKQEYPISIRTSSRYNIYYMNLLHRFLHVKTYNRSTYCKRITHLLCLPHDGVFDFTTWIVLHHYFGMLYNYRITTLGKMYTSICNVHELYYVLFLYNSTLFLDATKNKKICKYLLRYPGYIMRMSFPRRIVSVNCTL